MFEQFDFDTLGAKVSDKVVKAKAREITVAEVFKVLSAHFGEDFVSLVGSADIAISAGSRTVDGYSEEVPIIFSATAKEFHAHATASGKPVEVYDRLEEAKLYAQEKAEAERKAREKAETAAKKAEADRKAREADRAKRAKKGGE